MTTKLDDISEAIGALRAEVAGLRRDLHDSESRAVDSNKREDEHRSTIHRRVDGLVADVGAVKIVIAELKDDVTDAKTVTDEVKMWKAQGKGALFVVGIASAAISGSVVAFFAYWGDAIMKVLRSA